MGAVRAGVTVWEDALTEFEHRMLRFEDQWWKHAGAKQQAIRTLFDMSDITYYQLLNALIDRQAALVAYPLLVTRLHRARAERARRLAGRRVHTTH